MALIMREAKEARLEDPDILERIFGKSGPTIVKRNMELWAEASAALNAAAQKLLSASDQDSNLAGEREAFVKSLTSFAEQTEEMN